MKYAIPMLGLCLVATYSTAQTQANAGQATSGPVQTAASASPEFEAATIKPVKEPAPSRMNDQEEGRRFTTHNTTLSDLIVMAYGVDRRQVAGGPAWVTADEYDVDAVAEGAVSLEGNEKQWQAMLKKLLADRFELKFHYEQREMNVYALVVAKGGPKLKAADPNGQQINGCRSLGVCFFNKEPLAGFARFMGFVVLDKPVVDKTGLAAEFDFELKWTPDETQFASMGIHVPPPVDNPNAPPGLFTAIQEQLGLRLEPQKIPAEVLVIDHVERPSEN